MDAARIMNKLTSEKPNNDNVKELKIIISKDVDNVTLFCQNMDSTYSKEWYPKLLTILMPRQLYDFIVSNPDSAKYTIDAILYNYLSEHKKGSRNKTKQFMIKLIGSDNSYISDKTEVIPLDVSIQIARILVSWPIVREDKIFDYLESLNLSDDSLWTLCNEVIHDLDKINKSETEDVVWLISNMLTVFIHKGKMYSYVFNDFTDEVMLKLKPEIAASMYRPLLKLLDQPSITNAGLTLGSIHDAKRMRSRGLCINICISLSRAIECSESYELKSLVDKIDSTNHVESTMSLNAINLHWNSYKDVLLHKDNFNLLNYSELCDLIKRNLSEFTESDKECLRTIIKKSDFNQKQENISIYQSDLLMLLSGAELSSQYDNSILPPEERGKKLHFELYYMNDRVPLQDEETKDIELINKYLDNTESLESIEFLIAEKPNKILSTISIRKDQNLRAFNIVSTIVRSSIQNKSIDLDIINSLIRWCDNNSGFETKVLELFHDIVVNLKDHFHSIERNGIIYDWFIECYKDWYMQSIIYYLNKGGEDKSTMYKIIEETVHRDNLFNSSLALTFCLSAYGNYLYYTSDSEVRSILLKHENRLDISESCLKYINPHPDVIDMINNSGLFEEIISDSRANNNLNEAQKRLGYHTAIRFINDGLYEDTIIKGIEKSDWYYLEGCLIAILHNVENEENNVIKLYNIICNIKNDPNKHSTSYVLLKILDKSDSFIDLAKVVYGRSMPSFDNDDISCLKKQYSKHSEVIMDVVEIIANNPNIHIYDDGSLKELVQMIIKDYPNNLAIGKIQSGLVNNHHLKGYADL